MAKWACAALFLVNLIALSTQQPVFHEDVYTAIIREENEETPVQVLKVEASGDNLWYSLQDTASHYFSINPRTGEIELIKPLDRDEKAVYHIVAMATDADGYGASGFADVIIGLYDINDKAPEFMHEPYSFTVNEDATPMTVIGSMTATDLDDPNKPDHVSISYSITKNIQHNDTNVFEIDPMNGDIRLAYNDQTSFIRGESFEIEVQAEDRGGLKSTSTGTITVTGPPRFAQQLYFAELEKDMELDHVVIVVSAMDDIMSSQLKFSIVGGNEDSAFSIDNGTEANTADIKLQTDLMSVTSTDNTFNLTLQVSNSRYTSQATLFMKVMDTNLYAPVFDPPSYAVSWLENTTVGTVLETVTATDADDENSPNGEFHYSISDASKSTEHFSIDEDTGEITLTAELDRETDAQHTLEILAIDMGRTMKTGTASFTVTVEDVNDNAPMFAEDYRPIVMENGAVGEFVITITAVDRDTPANGPPFTFSTDSTHFYLNQTGDETADLWTNAVFDRETEEFYSVPIVITDVQGLSGTSTLTVQIGDMNDNPHGPGHLDATVFQYRGRGEQVVGYVYSEDEDIETESKTYTLLTTTEKFEVDTDTGAISIKDKTMQGMYHFKVNVADGVHPDQESTVNVTVKYIFESDIYHSTSMRLSGLSAADFIGKSGGQSSLQKFIKSLASVMEVDENLVDVLAVDDVELDAGTMCIMSAADMADVRYSVQGYHATVLDAAVAKNKDKIETDAGITISKVRVNPCEDSSVCGGGSCSVVYSMDTSDETLQDSGPNSLSLSIKTSMTAECTCKAKTCPAPSCDPNPCYNGGICQVTSMGYQCKCPVGYLGPRCQDTRRSFSGSGFAWYDSLKTCEDSHTSLEFITKSADGMLLYNGPTTDDYFALKDYIAIGMVDGKVKLSINFGNGTLHLHVPDSPRLDDRKWHKVDVYKHGLQVYLMIDGCMTSSVHEYPTYSDEDTSTCLSSGTVPGHDQILNLNSALQLGGTDSSYSYPTDISFDVSRGFDGCIRHLSQDGELLHLGNPAKEKDSDGKCSDIYYRCMDEESEPVCQHGECVADMASHHCVCDAGYYGADCSMETPEYRFKDDSYVTYTLDEEDTDIQDPKKTMYQISFRTANPSGTILSTTADATREGQEYIRIRLVDGIVTLEYDIGEGDMTMQVPDVLVNDSMWHSVKLMRSRNHFTLKVDKGVGCQQVESAAGTFREYLENKQSLIVGAMPDKSDDFIGCMKDLRIGMASIYRFDGDTGGTTATPSDGVEEGCSSACMSNPCNATDEHSECVDKIDGYICRCKDGYSDESGVCELIDECKDSQCLNSGTCVDQVGSFKCECTPEYMGDICQFKRVCHWDNPCKNGSTCMDKEPNDYQCECQTGWKGPTCTEVNACEQDDNPCHNGGDCESTGDNEYICHCAYGYKGDNCKIDDPCEPNRCRNGGECIPSSGSYTCNCPAGYNGDRCETYDYCHTNPCMNGGRCEVKQGGFRCDCKTGWKGTVCSESDPCGSEPCENGGTCIPTANNDGFMCSCGEDWGGLTCAVSLGKDDSRTAGLIAAGVLLGVAGLLALILLVHCCRNQQQPKKTASDYTEMDASSVSTSVYTKRSTALMDGDNGDIAPHSSGHVYSTVPNEEKGIDNTAFTTADEIDDKKTTL